MSDNAVGPDPRVGTEFAGYRIESLLGRGGMGVVYLAHHARLERKVALKVLAPELASDERFRERFISESKMAAATEHPHILPVHDAGEAEGMLFIAMRFVEGTDLGEIIVTEGPLVLERAIAIVDQVAGALDAAHARGLVHRDVKPPNILVTPDGDYAYLTDFGVARHVSTPSGLTGTGALLGTVDYMAPEQIEGKPLDGRTDVYALAAVLFECLAGAPPFKRDSEVATLFAHLTDPVPSLIERRPELPGYIDGVVARGMAKAKDGRFATCAALVAGLRAPAPAAPTQAAPAPADDIGAPTRGSRKAWVLVAGFVAVAAAAFFVARPGQPDTDDGRGAGSAKNVGATGECRVFPPDNAWNTPVADLPVAPNSAELVAAIGRRESLHPDLGSGLLGGGPIGIPVTEVPEGQAGVEVDFRFPGESDPGPYPIPDFVEIESGDDRHAILWDKSACKLYELFLLRRTSGGGWRAYSGAIWDLRSNALRPDGWTSADAAGLAILPGLVRFEEVAFGRIEHAIRFSAPRTRDAHIYPARHDASESDDPSLPPMGLRVRLRADFPVQDFPPQAQVILRALQVYGMMLADNGSPWFITGEPDPGWDNDDLHSLERVKGSDFEVVDTSSLRP